MNRQTGNKHVDAKRVFLSLFLLAGAAAALQVTLETPFNWANKTEANLSFSVDVNASWCALYTNQSGFSAVQNQTNLTAGNGSFLHNFSEGTHAWNVQCENQGVAAFAPANGSWGVDTQAPQITELAFGPSGVYWNKTEDDSGVRYELYRNGTLVYNASDPLEFNDTQTGQWEYALYAIDAAGNQNQTNTSFRPLTVMRNVNIANTSPRAFTAFWETDQAANASLTIAHDNGTVYESKRTEWAQNHSFSFQSPVFDNLTLTLVSCRRACVQQTTRVELPYTINQTVTLINATYNNQTATVTVRWTSQYGLRRVAIVSNNSGTEGEMYSTTLADSLFHEQNHSFVVNATAREVYVYTTATDALGENRISPNHTLVLNPNVSAPTPEPVNQTPSYRLNAGQRLNVTSDIQIELTQVSPRPTGPAQLLSGSFETFFGGSRVDTATIQEGGFYRNQYVAIRVLSVFAGTERYAIIQAEGFGQPVRSDTKPAATPTPSPSPLPTPSPTAEPEINTTAVRGKLVATEHEVLENRPNSFTGYLLAVDEAKAQVRFTAAYEHSEGQGKIKMVVRIQNKENSNVAVSESAVQEVNGRRTLTLASEPVSLPPDSYRAEVLIVDEERDALVLDQTTHTFDVKVSGVDYAASMIVYAGALIVALAAVNLKLSGHKRH